MTDEARGDGPIDDLPAEHTQIDYLLACDYAEVINGKAYMVGAGWDQFNPSQYPAQFKIGIAVGVRVPFLESNMPHQIVVTVQRDATEYFRMEGQLETGRRPGARGESTLVPIAVNTGFLLNDPQTIEVTADVDGRSPRRLAIRAGGGPQPPQIINR